jgi:hypothetical protein
MNAPYIESGCSFEHNGSTFTAGGAYVDDTYITAYPAKDGILNNWHGERMGTWRSTSRWRVDSYIGSHMHQIVATLDDGRIYTGRGFGVGMSFRGKRIASQRKA